MIRRFALALVLLGLAAACGAQMLSWPRPAKGANGLMGYVNSAGVFVIEPRYEGASWFTAEGVAKVRVDGKEGFIDRTGVVLVPPRREMLMDGYRHDAPMLVMHLVPGEEVRYAYIDARGELATGEWFQHAHSYRYGLAHVVEYGEGPPGLRPSRHGFIDTAGRLVIPRRFDDARDFAGNGLAAVRQGAKWGFIDARGEWVIPPRFSGVGDSKDAGFDAHGLARVRQGERWILIDAQGQRVGRDEWGGIGAFDAHGLAFVSSAPRWGAPKVGVIDTRGAHVFSPQFDAILPFKNGFARVEVAGRWGYIDTGGRITVSPRYPTYGSDFDRGGTARVSLELQAGPPGRVPPPSTFINTEGAIVLRTEAYVRFEAFNDVGFAVVRRDGRTGFIDNQGREAVGWYDDAHNFSETARLAPVRQGELWGYVDTSGRFVIPPRFDHAYGFGASGTAIVRQQGMWGHVDARGELVTPLKFNHLGPIESDGLAKAMVDGRPGYVDRDKNFVPLPPGAVR